MQVLKITPKTAGKSVRIYEMAGRYNPRPASLTIYLQSFRWQTLPPLQILYSEAPDATKGLYNRTIFPAIQKSTNNHRPAKTWTSEKIPGKTIPSSNRLFLRFPIIPSSHLISSRKKCPPMILVTHSVDIFSQNYLLQFYLFCLYVELLYQLTQIIKSFTFC